MRNMPLFMAADLVGCNPIKIRRLLHEEILSSLDYEELLTYIEKAPIIHDEEFALHFSQIMLYNNQWG